MRRLFGLPLQARSGRGAGGQVTILYLPRRECDLVTSGYSVKYRLAIIDRCQELEAKQSFNLPTTFAETLRSLADTLEENEGLLIGNEEM